MPDDRGPDLEFGTFEPSSRAEWEQRVVARAGREDAVARLGRKREDGGLTAGLYTPEDLEGRPAAGTAGASPFVRGGSPTRAHHAPWKVITEVSGDLDASHAALLEDLSGGANGFWLRLHPGSWSATPTHATGLVAQNLDQLARVLQGVELGMVTILLEAGPAASEVLLALEALARRGGTDPHELRVCAGLDPVGAYLRTEDEADAQPIAPRLMAELVGQYETQGLKGRALASSGRAIHQGGGSLSDQVAFNVASLIEMTRLGASAGLTPARVARQTRLQFEVGADVFESVAALRALRGLWSRVLQTSGVDDPPAPLIHATTSARTLTRRDPWVNLIRATTQTAAAVLGGADFITTRPHEQALGEPSALARRSARNLQHVLAMESHLGHVIDPLGGSYFVESLTEDLMRAAWRSVQEIEAEGGVIASLRAGKLQGRIRERARLRAERIATRKQPIVGVSVFPDQEPTIARPPREVAVGAPHADRCALKPASTLKEVQTALESGTGFAAIAKARGNTLAPEAVAPLPPIRDAEPFEALRDRADSLAAIGAHPKVWLSTLGDLRDHKARVGFAEPLFRAGGFEVEIDSDQEPAQAAARFAASGARIVCICGAEDAYAEHLDERVRALKAAGAQRVLVAGPPRDGLEVDAFIFLGVDAQRVLEDLLTHLAESKS